MVELSDTAVHSLASEILARPEYESGQPTGTAKLLSSLVHRFFEWLDKFQALHKSAPGLYWLILAGLFLGFALLVTHIAWSVATALRAPKPQEHSTFTNKPRYPIQDAERRAAEGSYLEAAHDLMIASYRALAEGFVIELRPDRSNRWIRLALYSSSLPIQLAGRISGLIERTEGHWFGDRENRPELYREWRSAFEELSRALAK